MAATDVAALGGIVLYLADRLKELGRNYYQTKDAWRNFPVQVRRLRARHDWLIVLLEEYGSPVEASFFEALEEAKKALTQEEIRLEKRNKRKEETSWKASLKKRGERTRDILFPETVGTAVQNVITAYDNLIEDLKSQFNVEQMHEDMVKRRPFELTIHEDSQNYCVRLELEVMISSALRQTEENSPVVVLVYGPAGIGKSTVARQVCSILKKESSAFTHIFELACGPFADTQAIQKELLHQLGNDDLSEISGKSVERRLQSHLLRKGKRLIFLDDVWKPADLQQLLNLSGPGQRVKYLVTSRQNVCKGLNCKFKACCMDELSKDDAKKILAIHAGFDNQQIPDDLQEMAEQLVNLGEGVPLVYASLGGHIAKGDPKALTVWTSVIENYLKCLSDGNPSTFTHGQEYPSSYWSALKLSIDTLSPQGLAKNLLFWIGAWRVPLVPRDLLEFFSNVAVSSESERVPHYILEQTKNELESGGLVLEKDEKQLALYPLTKELILKHMGEAINSFVSKELVDGLEAHFEQRTVIYVLAGLYIDSKFNHSVVSRNDLSLFSDVRVVTIEPITRLLVREINSSGNWSGELQTSASQVLVNFICDNVVDLEHVSRLLALPNSLRSTMDFLRNLWLDELLWQEDAGQTVAGEQSAFTGEQSARTAEQSACNGEQSACTGGLKRVERGPISKGVEGFLIISFGVILCFVHSLRGPISKGVSSLGIISLGFSLFLGKISWGTGIAAILWFTSPTAFPMLIGSIMTGSNLIM